MFSLAPKIEHMFESSINPSGPSEDPGSTEGSTPADKCTPLAAASVDDAAPSTDESLADNRAQLRLITYSEDSGQSAADDSRPSAANDDPIDFSQVLERLETSRATLLSDGLTSRDDGALLDSVIQIEQIRRCIDSISVSLLGEVHSRGCTDEIHGMRTGSWLARETGQSRGSANARVKLASTLRRRFSGVSAALNDGRIGYQHAEVLISAANPRIVDDWERVIDDLIEASFNATFNSWRNQVKAVAELLDQDGGHQPGDDITDNTLSLASGWRGTVGLKGQLAGENAIVVSAALEARADQIFHRMKADEGLSDDLPVPPRRTLLALALVELIREAQGKPITSTSPARTEAALVINAADPSAVTDTDGVPIGDTASSTLLCDPVFRPIVINTEGIVLDLGRDQRLVNNALRKALAHRDGGCTWPGCENPPEWCDAHHQVPWRDGGETNPQSLALLCRYHHGVTHRKGWTMHRTDDQWFWWESPSGNKFWSQRHGRQRSGPIPATDLPDRPSDQFCDPHPEPPPEPPPKPDT